MSKRKSYKRINGKKKIYSVTLSEKVVNQLNKKIGYGSRSKVIENLIIHDLKNSGSRNRVEATGEKKKDAIEQWRPSYNV